jgi:hypothetical protein
MRWDEHLAYMGMIKNAYTILVSKAEAHITWST